MNKNISFFHISPKTLKLDYRYLGIMNDFQVENKALLHYPFGMLMPGRSYSSETYRFGFQNQEKDDEIKGDGNSVNYTFRVHDTRLGRFLSVDPLANQYPFYSSYQFSGNRLIDAIELEGLEPKPIKDGDAESQTETTSEIMGNYGDHSKEWYWHSGSVDNPADWYSLKDYTKIRQVQNAILDVASQQGLVRTLLGPVPSFGTLETFGEEQGYDAEGFLKILQSRQASKIVSDFNSDNSGSGRITPTYIEFEFFLAAYGGTSALSNNLSKNAANGSNILGKSFGRLGTVIENPNIGVKMLDDGGHYLTGKINRMVPSADVIGTLKNPSVVLQQANGRYLYLSQKAGVVINQNGKLITTYGSGNFDASIFNVLKAPGH